MASQHYAASAVMEDFATIVQLPRSIQLHIWELKEEMERADHWAIIMGELRQWFSFAFTLEERQAPTQPGFKWQRLSTADMRRIVLTLSEDDPEVVLRRISIYSHLARGT
jgi:hypothetical protein